MAQRANAAKQIGEFGLPPKALYSTGELCGVLGIPWDRVQRMIQRGQLAENRQRAASGHRAWTTEEMLAAIEAHRARGADGAASKDHAR